MMSNGRNGGNTNVIQHGRLAPLVSDLFRQNSFILLCKYIEAGMTCVKESRSACENVLSILLPHTGRVLGNKRPFLKVR